METIHPSFSCTIETRPQGTFLVARGRVRPTAMSRAYRVRLEYQVKHRPQVFVEDPPLERRSPDERIPHTFSDEQPCLFRQDFRSDQLIARTVVPWLLLWLVFYESWHVTGEWQGGGEHPGEGVDGFSLERGDGWRRSAS
jgi:hypothetical protein